MPRDLRAVMRRHGPPSLLEFVEAEATTPRRGEVRIRVETAGVSPADLLICWGLHPEARRPPFTPGWDVIGRVDAVGDSTSPSCLGDRVAALTIVGGFSRYVCVPAPHAVLVPDGLDPAQAQCLPFDYLVAYQLLHRVAVLGPGTSALVQGAAGSIGGALLQLGHTSGVRLYGTASTAKVEFVERAGAVAIDYTRDDFVRAVRSCEPRGVDAGFDGVGHTLWRSARCVRRGGTVVAFGHASSVMGGRRDWRRFLGTVAQIGAVFAASPLTGWRSRLYAIQQLRNAHPDWYRDDLGRLLALLRARAIAPRVFRTMPLESAREALQLVSDGRVEGKVILRA